MDRSWTARVVGDEEVEQRGGRSNPPGMDWYLKVLSTRSMSDGVDRQVSTSSAPNTFVLFPPALAQGSLNRIHDYLIVVN